MFHSFFNSLAMSSYLSLFSHSFNFTLWCKVHNSASSLFLFFIFFFFLIMRSGCLSEIWGSVCISKSRRSLCVLFSWTDSLFYFYLFAQFSVDHLAHQTMSSLIRFLGYLAAFTYHVSSLSPRNLHLLFCCIISLLALIWFVLMALFCAAIRTDSVSILRLPFLSDVHVFSCEMSLKSSTELFFIPLLFSGYCRSAGPRVVSIVSGGSNQSSSALFYVVLESLYRCVHAVFNAGKSSSFLFSWYI